MARAIRVGGKNQTNGPEDFFIKAMTHVKDVMQTPYLYGASAAWCPRQNYFLSKKFESTQVETPTSSMYMAVGDGLEAAISKGLDRQHRLLFNNFYLPPMVPKVSGKIDLVYLDENDRISIGEVKSCGALPSAPKPSHLTQLLTYSAVAGYDRCNLIYMSRNVADQHQNVLLRVFPIEINRAVLMPIFVRILVSQMARDEDWMPDIPSNFNKSTCHYCPYADMCWKHEGELPYPQLTARNYDDKIKQAEVDAITLFETRTARNIASLRHLFRNVEDATLKSHIVREIELVEPF